MPSRVAGLLLLRPLLVVVMPCHAIVAFPLAPVMPGRVGGLLLLSMVNVESGGTF